MKINALEVAKWIQRVKAARKFFEDKLAESDEVVMAYQRRSHWEFGGDTGASVRMGRRFTANYVWANLQVLMPSVYAGVPRVLVKPRDETQVAAARSQEKFFNYVLPQIAWKQETRRAIRTAFLRGWGVRKLLWKPEAPGIFASPSEEPPPAVEPRSGVENIPPGAPFVKRISNFEFVCDPDANLDLSRARWVAHIFRRPVEEWQNEKLYAHREEIKAGSIAPSFEGFYSKNQSLSDFRDQELAEGFEIWVRECAGLDRKLLTIAPGVTEAMRFEDWPYEAIESFPFDVIQFHEEEEEQGLQPALPIGECRAWMPLQRAMNLLVSKLVTHVDKFDRLFEIMQGGLASPTEAEKLVSGADGSYILTTRPAGETIRQIDNGTLPAEYFSVIPMIQGMLQEISGIGDLQRGNIAASTTATVGQIQQANASLRASDRREIIAAADRRAVRLMKQIAQGYLTEEFLIPVAGQGGTEWVHVDPSHIRAELDVEIDVDSIAPETLAARQQRNMFALQTAGPMLNSPNGVAAGVRELLRRVLHDQGFEDEELFLPPLATGIPEQEHVAWLLDDSPAPQVSPADDDTGHLASHVPFRDRNQAALQSHVIAQTPSGPVTALDVVNAHIQDHQGQLQRKRAQGGLSVRGGLRPMAPAMGTPGGAEMPMAESSIGAPTGLPA